MSKSTNQFDAFTQAGQNYFEAIQKSVGILTKGNENIVRTSLEISQNAAEKQAGYAKEILSCKTLTELTEAQRKIAQDSFEDFMSGVTKISEISTKVLTESSEPLNEQINKTVQNAKKAA